MHRIVFAFIILLMAIVPVYAQKTADSLRKAHAKRAVSDTEYGIASYYHRKFQGKPTASGQKYDTLKMTAAHNSLPFGTRIKVTNVRNNRHVIVVVNDRLHHKNTRLVDLSLAGARKLGFVSRGLTRVKVEVLKNNQ